MKEKKSLTAIVEKNDDGLWARIETIPNFLVTAHGETAEMLVSDLRVGLTDYLENEGKTNPEFAGLTAEDLDFVFEYDLQAFFEEFSYLKITEVAKIAGINGGLLRQYASGVKQASEKQVHKIEEAIHKMARTLMEVQIIH